MSDMHYRDISAHEKRRSWKQQMYSPGHNNSIKAYTFLGIFNRIYKRPSHWTDPSLIARNDGSYRPMRW